MSRLVVAWARDTGPTTGLALMNLGVERLTGSPAGDFRVVHACRHCGSDTHGKRQVIWSTASAPATHVSVSRAGDLVLVVVTDAGPAGVDIEIAGTAGFDAFDAVVLHDEEKSSASDPTRVWVRKESVLKATGHGLAMDPREIRVSPPDDTPALLAWPAAEDPIGPSSMFDLDVPSGFVAAATVLSDVRPTLVTDGAAWEV